MARIRNGLKKKGWRKGGTEFRTRKTGRCGTRLGGTASGLHPGVGHNSELSGPGVRGDGLGAWFRGRGAGGREHLRVATSNLTSLWAPTQTTLFQHHTPVLHASWVKHT